jgi:predicted metalloprotease with PDZ domain
MTARRLLTIATLLLTAGAAPAADPPPVAVEVDASEVARKIVHTRLTVPAEPGPLALHYPKWIPGTHSPIGPVTDQAGLRIKAAGGDPLEWRRDDDDPYTVSCTVPAGAKAVEVTFDLLMQTGSGGLGSSLTVATPKLMVLNWNEVVVYPAGEGAMRRPYRAAIKLPAGWKFGTALPTDSADVDRVAFKPVTLETLIDSPLLAGEHDKEVPLGEEKGRHRVVMACDSPDGLDVPAETVATWNRLVAEAGRLHGTRHYERYTFLLALSNQFGGLGIEHHQSSDNRLPELTLTKSETRKLAATLFPHEYTHSWNGKHRRPAEMITPDFQKPHRTRLLWVYEGLTNYLGWVLAARSGALTPEEAREDLALAAGRVAAHAGRAWRPLDDTAAAAHLLYAAPGAWQSWRRTVDFYDEGTLLWLEADVLIRQQTQGKKSLDDFCRLFFGGEGGKATVRGYTFDDVVAALNEVAPYDWKAHWARRVSLPAEQPPLGGITEGGWRLGYGETPTAMQEAGLAQSKGGQDLTASIGLLVGSGGVVADVVPGAPAAKAGLAPGMKLIAVNGRKWSPELLSAAVAATRKGGPLELLAENGEFYKAHKLDYQGGAKFPRLERYDGRPDVIADVIKPLTPAEK